MRLTTCCFIFLLFLFQSLNSQVTESSIEIANWPTSPEYYKVPLIKDSVTKLAFVNIVSLQNNLRQYKNLKRIDIFSSPRINLAKVVSQIKMLPSVVALGLAACELKTFPIEVCSLVQLKSLSIVRDSLGQIPPDLSLLINLQWLDLGDMLSGGNKISEFNIDLSPMKNLRHLHLFGNRLKRLPKGIEHLPLIELDLKANELTDVTIVFSITSLKWLNLADNEISSLGSDLIRLNHLEEIYLSGNPITKLPAINGNMESLIVVELPKLWNDKERNDASSFFPNAKISYW